MTTRGFTTEDFGTCIVPCHVVINAVFIVLDVVADRSVHHVIFLCQQSLPLPVCHPPMCTWGSRADVSMSMCHVCKCLNCALSSGLPRGCRHHAPHGGAGPKDPGRVWEETRGLPEGTGGQRRRRRHSRRGSHVAVQMQCMAGECGELPRPRGLLR